MRRLRTPVLDIQRSNCPFPRPTHLRSNVGTAPTVLSGRIPQRMSNVLYSYVGCFGTPADLQYMALAWGSGNLRCSRRRHQRHTRSSVVDSGPVEMVIVKSLPITAFFLEGRRGSTRPQGRAAGDGPRGLGLSIHRAGRQTWSTGGAAGRGKRGAKGAGESGTRSWQPWAVPFRPARHSVVLYGR